MRLNTYLNEKEGRIMPHVKAALKSLNDAEKHIDKSFNVSLTDDDVVSPGELSLIRQIKTKIDKLKKIVDGEL